MPTYQYACTECEHDFEQVQSFTDDALTVCPVCSGRLRKVFNAVGVVFKGSGFYRNDSRDAKASGRDGSGEGTKESGGKDSGAKESGESGTKESGGSGTKESGTKEAAASGSSSAAGDSGATKPSKPAGPKTSSAA